MKKYGSKAAVLGVMVTSRSVNAVLLEDGPEGPHVLRRFRRHRSASGSGDMAAMPPVTDNVSSDDFTIQFGAGGDDANLFLGSEFVGIENTAPAESAEMDMAVMTATFEMELADILSECSDAGYEDPLVAFCGTSTDVTTVELIVPAAKEKRKSESAKSSKKKKETEETAEPEVRTVGREELMALLQEQHEGEADEERVAFLPMTVTEQGLPRFLAVVAKATEPVYSTLNVMRGQKKRMPVVRLLDTEVSAYLGLSRVAWYLRSYGNDAETGEAYYPDDEPRKTLIVRAGAEDTLVMFIEDDVLQHYESLRSITAFDAPETVCSRVLLLQDEYGTGDVQNILILADEREQNLIDSFTLFFPDTQVESLHDLLPKYEEVNDDAMARDVALAVAAGLRLVDDELYKGAFPEINLLPKQMLKRRIRMPVTWHVVALYIVLFSTVLFFMARFFTQKHEIDLYEYKLQQYETGVTEAGALVLQARIDSLRAISTGYVRALDVLDSLLIGSDRWSRAMERTARETAAVSGIWVEGWRERNDMLELVGNATTRDHVVSLAESLEASIETLSFSEIREWPVYSFRMVVPMPRQLPEAARYLRERVNVDDAVPVATSAAEGTTP